MKLVLVALALTLPMIAQAKTVSGLRADAMISAGAMLGIDDHSMGGRVDVEMTDVSCTKTVTDTDGSISCTYTAYDGEKNATKTVSGKDDGTAAFELRNVVRELMGNEKTISPTQKVVSAKSIKCHSAGFGHILDALEIETISTCTLK